MAKMILLAGLVLASALPAAAQEIRSTVDEDPALPPIVPPVYPPVPNLTVTVVDAATLQLDWTAPDDPYGTYEYDIAVSTDGPIEIGMFNYYFVNGGGFIIADYSASWPAGTPASLTVTGLQEGVTYWFAVVSYNTNDSINGYSNDVSGTPLTPPVPTTPPTPTPTPTSDPDDDSSSSSSACSAGGSQGIRLVLPLLVMLGGALVRRR